MKKLFRSTSPQCLNSLKLLETKTDTNVTATKLWDQQIHNHKKSRKRKESIWNQINILQNNCCAYCERTISKQNHHIDHFFPKSQKRSETFNWQNLFGSCDNQKQICGHKKGNAIPLNIIKPDIEDPKKFFKYSSSGEVEAISTLNVADTQKAADTINIFNLNDNYLISLRSRAYQSLMTTIKSKLVSMPDKNSWKPILTKYRDQQQKKEFCTYTQYLLDKMIKNLSTPPKNTDNK